MTARDDLANLAADAAVNAWSEFRGASADKRQHLPGIASAVLDAFAAHPDLHIAWLTETGVLIQVGWQWVDDGIADGGLIALSDTLLASDSRCVPVFRVVDRSDTT